MILVSHTYRFALVTLPKCACSTMRLWFHCLETDRLEDFRVETKGPGFHRTISRLYDGRMPRAGYRHFCVIRNPWTRLISAYGHKASRNATLQRIGVHSFSGFLRFVAAQNVDSHSCNPHWRTQASYFRGMHIDRFLKVESLQADFNAMLETIGLEPNAKLPVLNRARPQSGPDSQPVVLCPEEAELIGRLYAEDVSLGDYHCPDEVVDPQKPTEEVRLSSLHLGLHLCRERIRGAGGLVLQKLRRLRRRLEPGH